MIGVMEVRDALREGPRDVDQLSRLLGAPKALLEAMLERLVALGKVERAEPPAAACGSCRGCVEARGCAAPMYRLSAQRLIVSCL
ncbi:Ferrous iron transport protein C [compost metagenome]|uniref:Ferrous iron transport protein C n=1 Tax=Pseudomonas jinjuensis TaxID=198616 RepID=A0A1H0Q0L6_9PSED|nr:FeoC-like transcriptional regulator [Pseudomonas jinjuensis]SDP10864.1 ferrous iron transport protein C [Pseudomonas jinjuensis]